MWEDPVPPVEGDAQPYEEPGPPVEVAWTDGQIMRLENEWRKAQRAFAYHPIIGIAPLHGDPPFEYQIDYRVRSLIMNEEGQLQYVDGVSVHLWLPPGFPNQAPVARPMESVFHPNISPEGVSLTHSWQPTDSLVDFAGRVGELLAYRSYDPESVVNPVAMDWLAANSHSLPLDAHADFSPFNGGEPLGRIQRLGPATLEQIRRALDNMRFALLAEEGAPTPAEVEDFSRKTRAAVSLFLDGEVPDTLREQANECDDWCRELPDSIPLWDYLRHQRTRAGATEQAADALRKSAAAFAIGLRELESLVRSAAPGSAASAIKTIPPMEKLEHPHLKLPPLGREFEKWAAEARSLLEAIKEEKPEVPIAPDGSMGRRLASQAEMVRETIDTAMRAAQAALTEVDPLLRRAGPEVRALEQVVGWREYMDMVAKARALEKQLAEWGSSGVQAFYLANSSGSFGPFQFEEPVDLGGARVVVRSLQRGQIEVINPVGQEVLGRQAADSITLLVGKSEGNPGYPTTFTLTERCDDLLVQLGFIQQQTIDALSQFQQPVTGAKTWCGTMSTMLSDHSQQQQLRESNRKAAHRWKVISSELAALSRFKERLATYNLVARMSEEVPRLRGLIAAAEVRHKDSTQTIATVMSKSSRDVASDQFIVPPKYANTYSEALRTRDQARQEVVRQKNLLKQIARELVARVGSSRLCGRPEVPEFRVLPAIPAALWDLHEPASDDNMRDMLQGLSGQLGVQLPFNPPPPPIARQVGRPAQPTAPPPSPEPVAEAPMPETSENVTEMQSAADQPAPAAAESGATSVEDDLSVAPVEHDGAAVIVPSHDGSMSQPAIEYTEEAAPEEEIIEGFFTEDASGNPKSG